MGLRCFYLSIFVATLSNPAIAQWDQLHYPCSAEDAKAIPAGGKVVPPEVIRQVEPQFTDEARKLRMPPRRSALSLTVGTNGQACNIRILSPADFGLDANAIAALRQWRFRPATSDGKPVPFTAMVEVNFSYAGQNRDFTEPERSHLNAALAQINKGGTADKAKGMEALSLLAQKDYPPAQAFLGLMLLEGAKPADRSRGLQLVRQADKSNSPMGIFALGLAYLQGLGVPQNRAQALEQFMQASFAGLPEAMLQIGTLLSEGEASPVELEAAEYYLRRCAVLRNAACASQLAIVIARRSPHAKSKTEALAWALRARSLGAGNAQAVVQKLDGPHRKDAEALEARLPSYQPQ